MHYIKTFNKLNLYDLLVKHKIQKFSISLKTFQTETVERLLI